MVLCFFHPTAPRHSNKPGSVPLKCTRLQPRIIRTISRRTIRMTASEQEIKKTISELGLGDVIASTKSGSSGWASMRTFTTDRGVTYFAKISRENESMFRGEAASLRALFRTGTIRVPEVFHMGKLEKIDASYILMEKLKLRPVFDFQQLGRQLAELHLAPPVLPEAKDGQFGFEVDNTIGSTSQPNRWMDDWVDFYRERRLLHQARLTGDKEIMQQIDKLCARLDEFFVDVKGTIKPSLIHGDLWSGNISGCDGDVAIFDPASYYGHHEAEFGMSWCAGFSEYFWQGYRSLIPEDEGFKKRRPLYQLYHYLNHLNLFGGGYYNAVKSILADLNEEKQPVKPSKMYEL